ncbi:MAG: Hsp20/alpha crystallin family protein [Bacteriovoracaceae bacterium]|nr:Hsp20/alpha crystallin family protein [Bacteriovoracaceae bacterium]
MKIFLISFLISFILSSNISLAQNTNDEQLKRQIDEVMKARDEMLKSLMDDSFSGEFEKRMEDIMKRFGGIGPGNPFDKSDSLAIGSYNWEETPTEKILKIKVTQSKDQPLDIKIENGMISIKGIAETLSGTSANKIKSRMNFQKSFSLPTDIDQSNPEFKNNEKLGELWITFKKIMSKKSPKPVEERIPVKPTDQDISI